MTASARPRRTGRGHRDRAQHVILTAHPAAGTRPAHRAARAVPAIRTRVRTLRSPPPPARTVTPRQARHSMLAARQGSPRTQAVCGDLCLRGPRRPPLAVTWCSRRGRDSDIVRETFERTGASVMGKRMFDAGEQAWPQEAQFHMPVFVVTHEKRDPWERPGGVTFHLGDDGIEPALDQAREAAGDRDVRIAGSGATSLAYVNAGLIDEFSIALSPVLFRLRNPPNSRTWTRAASPWRRSAQSPPGVTHPTYAVRER